MKTANQNNQTMEQFLAGLKAKTLSPLATGNYMFKLVQTEYIEGTTNQQTDDIIQPSHIILTLQLQGGKDKRMFRTILNDANQGVWSAIWSKSFDKYNVELNELFNKANQGKDFVLYIKQLDVAKTNYLGKQVIEWF